MTVIPKEVQEYLEGKLAWVATASDDGMPNTTPKGTVRIVDDEHIIFADLYSLKTRQNLQANPKVAITVVDTGTVTGYQIKGSVELVNSGSMYEEMATALADPSKDRPPLEYLVLVTVESVYDQSVGPNAGMQIA